FILVKIITIKTKFLRTCLWTLRLVQLQNFFLIEEGVIPLLLQYVLAIVVFNLLILIASKLLLQIEEIKFIKWSVLIGIVSSVLPIYFPAFVSLFFVCYIFMVVGGVIWTSRRQWDSTLYVQSKNWSYWISLFIFVFNVLFLSLIMIFLPSLELFAGIWQVIVTELVLILFGILFYNNRLLLHNSSLLLLILLGFLCSWIIFVYIVNRSLSEILWVELVMFSIAYLGTLIHTLHLLGEDNDHYYTGLSALIREEILKEEFANFLHDDILQDLNAMIQLSRIKNSDEVLSIISENLDRLNIFTRNQMNLYSPQLLKGLSLYENYLQMIESIRKRYPDVSLNINLYMDSELRLPPPYDVLVYRWVRELVNNSFKYSQGSYINIRLTVEDSTCKIVMVDDGIYTSETTIGEGHGLKTISAQLRAVGGSIKHYQVEPQGFGTFILFEIEGDKAIESFINR
ncbi:TPA: sensor histidine kinase, partial [Streptococcus suis]